VRSVERERQRVESETWEDSEATRGAAPQHHQPEEVPSQEPVCQEAPYPRYEPGIYEAECVSARVYFHPALRAWKCQLDFQILPNGEPICGFLHLGNNERPSAGPSSEYRRAWIIAAGQAPRKRQVICRFLTAAIILPLQSLSRLANCSSSARGTFAPFASITRRWRAEFCEQPARDCGGWSASSRRYRSPPATIASQLIFFASRAVKAGAQREEWNSLSA
jgi:hypothetical protein